MNQEINRKLSEYVNNLKAKSTDDLINDFAKQLKYNGIGVKKHNLKSDLRKLLGYD